MDDGLNNARAIRIAEILNDFRSAQHFIASLQPTPSPAEVNLPGYAILQQCIAEAQTLLAAPFNADVVPATFAAQRAQLRSVILDASVRRFRCQRAYLRAVACARWIQARLAVTQGQPLNQSHLPGLQNADIQLQAELASISNAQVEYSLRSNDEANERWLAEDPSLATILAHV